MYRSLNPAGAIHLSHPARHGRFSDDRMGNGLALLAGCDAVPTFDSSVNAPDDRHTIKPSIQPEAVKA